VHLLETELERAYEKVQINTEIAEPQYIVDARLSLEEVNWDLWRDIAKLAPFGVGNPKPLFLFEGVMPRAVEQFGKERQHLKLVFEKQNGEKVSAIKFYAKPEDLGLTSRREVKPKVNLLAHLEKSTFGNYPELRLRIVDLV
jgi:single-stranded-DNA-specific exonuclease